MRTVMYLGSLAMVATGIFCLANGSAAFLSVAFVVGIIFSLVGIIEVIIGRRSDITVFGKYFGLISDGIAMTLFGIVILAGQVTDDITAQMLFALWMIIEAIMSVGDNLSDDGGNKVDNAGIVLNAAMLMIGIYTFFNTKLLNINAISIIGAALMLLGLRRFRLSFGIEYGKSGFLTGNEERLEEAQAEEKKALAKAKEGIREQKIAQRKIDKIKKDIEQETTALNDTANRKKEMENK